MSAPAPLSLRFLGGAGTVTGSRYLVQYRERRLLVDCGLFQGLKQLRLRNWAPFPLPPGTIDAVVLTHAHLDHSGYLPRLVEEGFRGVVHVTPGTGDLLPILLRDAGRLQEEDARYANRHGFSKHSPALPLYTEAQAMRALERVRPRPFDRVFEPLPGLMAKFSHAGHIVGAASLHLATEAGSITFSGDLGRTDDPVMRPPACAEQADLIVVESTYGNRRHATAPTDGELAEVISRTAARGGTTLIPAFAVGRAQAVLHALLRLKAAGRIPDLPIYLNSPMAIQAGRLLEPHADELRLSEPERRDLAEKVRYIRTEEESRALNAPAFPSIIVAASGMATGAACCTTSRRWLRIRSMRSSLSVTRPPARAAPVSSPARTRCACTANGSRCVHRCVPSRACPRMRIRRSCSTGCRPCSAGPRMCSSPTASRSPPTRCVRRSKSASVGPPPSRSTSTPWPGRRRFDRQAEPQPLSLTHKEFPCAP